MSDPVDRSYLQLSPSVSMFWSGISRLISIMLDSFQEPLNMLEKYPDCIIGGMTREKQATEEDLNGCSLIHFFTSNPINKGSIYLDYQSTVYMNNRHHYWRFLYRRGVSPGTGTLYGGSTPVPVHRCECHCFPHLETTSDRYTVMCFSVSSCMRGGKKNPNVS